MKRSNLWSHFGHMTDILSHMLVRITTYSSQNALIKRLCGLLEPKDGAHSSEILHCATFPLARIGFRKMDSRYVNKLLKIKQG